MCVSLVGLVNQHAQKAFLPLSTVIERLVLSEAFGTGRGGRCLEQVCHVILRLVCVSTTSEAADPIS